jgi:hypothetical protein
MRRSLASRQADSAKTPPLKIQPHHFIAGLNRIMSPR